jgi:hypothetical protein
MPPLPHLTDGHEPTRATLHAYARAVEAVPRAHGIAHPKWWHVSLKVRPEGLVTDPVPLPGGGSLGIRMDLRRHEVVVDTSTGDRHAVDMQSATTATEVADRLIAVSADHGLVGGYDRSRFENEDARAYDPGAAAAYGDAFTAVHAVLERHRAGLGERVSPIQVWPHGFDLSFEWFGTMTVEHDGGEAPAQLNLGFYPAGEPYFYSSPWPFDEALTRVALPHRAVWNTEGWQGALLPYDAVRVSDDPGRALSEFAAAVYEAAAPTLTVPGDRR